MPDWLLQLLNPAGGIIQTIASFIPNPEERAKAQMQLQAQIVNAYITADADQRAINKQEAASGSLFVAGGRPAAIWLCVTILALHWLLFPCLVWIVSIWGGHLPPPPTINKDEASTLLYALLGVSGLRLADKAIPGGLTKTISGIFKKK